MSNAATANLDKVLLPNAKNDDAIIKFLNEYKESLHQDFNFIWVFPTLLKKMGLNINEWSTLYMIFILSENKGGDFTLSRADIATNLNLSIDTINKHIPKLKKMEFEYQNEFGFVEKKPLIEGLKKKKYYHQDGELIERDGASYTPGVSSEIIRLNKGFVAQIRDFLLQINSGLFVKRVKIIPALTKIPFLANGKCLNLTQLYRLECLNAKEKMNKEGVSNKTEISRDFDFARQNLYTTSFKTEIRGTVLEDFKYRGEEGFTEDKALIKISPTYKKEVEFFYEQRAIFLPHKKAEKQNAKSALIMQLWAAHASARHISLSISNEMTFVTMKVIKNQLNFLKGDVFSEKVENFMGIFNNFQQKNENYFGKFKDITSLESTLLSCIDQNMLTKIKTDYAYTSSFDAKQIAPKDFNAALASYAQICNDLDNNIGIFIETYKNRVEAILQKP